MNSKLLILYLIYLSSFILISFSIFKSFPYILIELTHFLSISNPILIYKTLT